ncbi:hypothetical protein EV356DRAFT_233198 [Viridothelium virens]|uniref:Uncharacterized protein n=1 Tax=Viridothelium virens TaxID=1048519 RepID=A0A6A6H5V3_VIRVR|nr:hypothetical protein EV356DRAFT_233198 [Viridothelium virens]
MVVRRVLSRAYGAKKTAARAVLRPQWREGEANSFRSRDIEKALKGCLTFSSHFYVSICLSHKIAIVKMCGPDDGILHLLVYLPHICSCIYPDIKSAFHFFCFKKKKSSVRNAKRNNPSSEKSSISTVCRPAHGRFCKRRSNLG